MVFQRVSPRAPFSFFSLGMMCVCMYTQVAFDLEKKKGINVTPADLWSGCVSLERRNYDSPRATSGIAKICALQAGLTSRVPLRLCLSKSST